MVLALHRGSFSTYANGHSSASSHSLLFCFAYLLPALFFLPLVTGGPISSPLVFPYNMPAWSLFYELLANVVHALFLRRRTTKQLAIALVFLGTTLLGCLLKRGTVNAGVLQGELIPGTIRVMFSYILGMFLFRIRSSTSFRSPFLFLLPIAALIVVVGTPSNHFNVAYDIAAVFAVIPLIVFFAAQTQTQGGVGRILGQLGVASYAIYVLHVPLAKYFVLGMLLAKKRFPFIASSWYSIAFLVGLLIFAIAMDRFYDTPVRRWLRTRYGSRHPDQDEDINSVEAQKL